jgi:RND family efflux transporter MFP subunit
MKSVPRFPSFPVTSAIATALSMIAAYPCLHASSEPAPGPPTAGRLAVNVVIARHSPAATELTLPASLRALQEAPIYARTNGYLASFSADLGDRVKAGQTLATIEAPEVDQELNQSRAALEQARANLTLARSSAVRWQELGTQHAVAQQEVDEKQAALAARDADVHAAEANVSRLTQLKQYQNITAPFDGVISARNVDIGALITSGAAGRELFRVAQTGTLRVYVNVPQSYFRSITPDMPVDVTVNELPSRVFTGKVVRIAGALDAATRTLLIEVQIPNEKGELLAGMFGQVRLRLQSAEPPLIIPSNAVIVRNDGNYVAVVDAANTVHLAKVKLGRDFGITVEIGTGLSEGAHVVSNPNDTLSDGLVVDPLLPAPEKKN